jgi:hypothetical protein
MTMMVGLLAAMTGIDEVHRYGVNRTQPSSLPHDDRLRCSWIGEFDAPFLNGAMSCLSPGGGRLTDDAPERTGEMRLIAHAATQSNLS